LATQSQLTQDFSSGYPSSKPGYDLQYNVGWAILDETDPSVILDRATEPLLSPELPWEIGVDALTPNVVFCEGWEQIDVNTFILYYGAADTAVGAALLTVVPPSQ
jgi:beta-1,2-mannobiose phosphorylase / 1,2-beta-oligomannan phosphorylase